MDYEEQFIEGTDKTLSRLNEHHVRAILNILVESTFFYRTDDVDLFAYLRSNLDDFNQFFNHFYGWELYVDRSVARVIKPREFNNALKPSQRDLFDLTRRDECVVFLLLIEFYEKLLRDLSISYDDEGSVRFLLADFIQYSINRFIEELGEGHENDKTVLEAARRVFPKLIKYRFIEQIEKEDAAKDETLPGGMREHVMYEFLPGIHCYRPDILTLKEVIGLYKEPAEEVSSVQKADGSMEEADNSEPSEEIAEESVAEGSEDSLSSETLE